MSEKPQNLPDVAKQQDIQKTKENIAKTTADSYTKEGIIKTITNEPKSVKDITSKYLKQSLDLKDYSDKKDAELNAILEGKESKEKHSEKVRDSIMMKTMNPESVDNYIKRFNAKLTENGGVITSKKDIQKARLELNREIYSERKDKLDSPLVDEDGKPLYDKEGKIITKTKYEDILEKNKDLAKLNTKQNPELAKELLAVYGEKGISSYMKLLKDVPEDKIPKNLEEINKLMEQKFGEKYLKERMSEKREGDKPLPPEELKKEIKKSFSNTNTVNALATSYNQVPGENVKGSLEGTDGVEELNEVIKKLPEGKVKSLFSNLLHFIGKGKTDPELRKFVKSNSNWDPIDGYYCRAFLNAGLESIGIPTNKNNLSKDALNIGREVPKKEEMLPGDIVVLSRNGTDTSGNPGTHVGIFAGWTKNGDMLFLSGNSTGGRVTCKPRSTKKIIGMRRFVDSREENALRNIEK